ncbi:methyltransferase domain-containing protein [Taibaiella koreensis]|uniref:methyltransferase domain-containing protein n=1 Tax=Taibaiella koreensis TaxID=1268548 RepID=UPI000E59F01C|nr:methyltransferase domain-containing protein [Taibaiella koreensis]
MAEHLYNIDYLEQTMQLLGKLKQQSYNPFSTITEGTIADVGCGTGADAINMARMLPGLEIIGLDYAPEMITKATADAGDLPNISFRQAEASALPFADNTLAGIRNERLIQHVPDPAKVFAEFYRTLKPGQPLVNVETDWSSIAFYNGNAHIAKALNHYLTFKNVKNGNAAANLISDMTAAGFRDIGIELFPLASRSLQQVTAMLRIDHALMMMKTEKHISEVEYNSFLSALEDADRNRYFVCSINLVVTTATK